MSEFEGFPSNIYGPTSISGRTAAILGNVHISSDVLNIQQAIFSACSAITLKQNIVSKPTRSNHVFPDHTLEIVTCIQECEGAEGSRVDQKRLRWERKEGLGAGMFGEVHREECKGSSNNTKSRAVKVLRKAQLECARIDYKRELDALVELSQVGQQLKIFHRFD